MREESEPPWVLDLRAEAPSISVGGDGLLKVGVLVVDDDPLFTRLMTSMLCEADDDFEVVAVSTLGKAVARLAGDGIALVIADLHLPDCTGPATVGLLRRAAPGVPVIVLSAVDDGQLALDAVREGAEGYLIKGTFSVDSLLSVVRRVLGRHLHIDVAQGNTPGSRAGGFINLAALQVVGRHLIQVAERTGVYFGVAVVTVDAAPGGEWADGEHLLDWASDLLEATLRGCDLLSRTGRTELAAMLISGSPVGGAVKRLRAAIDKQGAGHRARVGFAGYDFGSATSLDALLERARRDARPVPGES
jgi:CheY-like chemotaxis protein